jgi:hypothetical protein
LSLSATSQPIQDPNSREAFWESLLLPPNFLVSQPHQVRSQSDVGVLAGFLTPLAISRTFSEAPADFGLSVEEWRPRLILLHWWVDSG